MSKNSVSRFGLVMGLGLVSILLTMYISLTTGVINIGLKEVVDTVFRLNPTPENDLVLLDFRLPRIILAGLVGMGLGIAGAVIQGVSRNGLADPGILGINAGAGAAVVVFLFFFQGKIKGTDLFSILAMPLFGLAGGLGAAILIYTFAWRYGGLDTQRLLLVGIAASYGLGAFSLYLTLKMNPNDFETATVWVTGSIYNANWRYVVAMLPWFVILIPFILKRAYLLDLLQLEEESVKSLGVATEREKAILLLSSIGIVSACVAVSGGIGFIGLLAPHISKRLVGIGHNRVIPACGVVGSLLVIISDFLARRLFSPAEIPVGVVVAIVGVPYFFYLLFRARV